MDKLDGIIKKFDQIVVDYDKVITENKGKKYFIQIIKNHILYMIEKFITYYESKEIFSPDGDEGPKSYRKFLDNNQSAKTEPKKPDNSRFELGIKNKYSTDSSLKPNRYDTINFQSVTTNNSESKSLSSVSISKTAKSYSKPNSTNGPINNIADNDIVVYSPTKASKISNLANVLKNQNLKKNQSFEDKNNQIKQLEDVKKLLNDQKTKNSEIIDKLKTKNIPSNKKSTNKGNQNSSKNGVKVDDSVNDMIEIFKTKILDKLNKNSLTENDKPSNMVEKLKSLESKNKKNESPMKKPTNESPMKKPTLGQKVKASQNKQGYSNGYSKNIEIIDEVIPSIDIENDKMDQYIKECLDDYLMNTPMYKFENTPKESKESKDLPSKIRTSYDSTTLTKAMKEEMIKDKKLSMSTNEIIERKPSMRISSNLNKSEDTDYYERLQTRISGRKISERESRKFMNRQTQSYNKLLEEKNKERESKRNSLSRTDPNWGIDSSLCNLKYEFI